MKILQVRKHNKYMNLNFEKKVLLFICGGTIIISNSFQYLFLALMNTSHLMILIKLCFFFPLVFPNIFIIYQLAFATYSLNARYKILNELLTENFSTNVFITLVSHKAVKSKKEYFLSEIIVLHDQLSDGIFLINSTFTFQMIPIMAVILSNSILTLHQILEAFILKSDFAYALILDNTFWYFYYMVILGFLLKVGSETTNEATKTGVSVVKIIRNIQDDHLLSKFNSFLEQINKRDKIIHNTFFNIDWALMFTVLTSTTTLLIITCQFDSTIIN